MLKGKKYKVVDGVFPFLAGSIDGCTAHMKEAPLTKVHVLYSELLLCMTTDNGRKSWSEMWLGDWEYRTGQFKRSLLRPVSDHFNLELYTLKFHVPDHVVEVLLAFDILPVLH